jgi:cytoskeletal protein CcmA (bactofilin family)
VSIAKTPAPEFGDLKVRATATIIAVDTTVTGELKGSRATRIEGAFSGTVDISAPLDIVEGATVAAEIRASRVRVAGRVTGDVHATELVELLGSAMVTGDVHTPALHVIEGARLEGRVQMQSTQPGPVASKLK